MSIFDTIVSRTPVDKGWSGDQKYKAVTADGTAYFLRISPMGKLKNLRPQFSHMEQVRDLGVRVSEPVELGICAEGVYTLLEWIDGRDAEPVLPTLDGERQYAYGLDAGRMLKRIHSLPAPIPAEPWADRYQRKLDGKFEAYEKCPLKYEKGELYLDLLRRERHLIKDRPQAWCHGDYHCGNMMFDSQMRLTVIDFDREDIEDPWYEFNRLIWDIRAGGEYASGVIDGYFEENVPEEFWRILRLYLAQNVIFSLPWALDFGEDEVRIALENVELVREWYDDLREIVPNWYHR